MSRSDDKYLIPGVVPPDTICDTCGEPKEVPCMTCGGECGVNWRHVHDDWMTVYVGNCLRSIGNEPGPIPPRIDLPWDANVDLSIVDLDDL
jgi:hypothetical protein